MSVASKAESNLRWLTDVLRNSFKNSAKRLTKYVVSTTQHAKSIGKNIMSETISREGLKELLSEALRENQEPEIGLVDVVRVVRKYARIALLCGACLAAVVAFCLLVAVPLEYSAAAEFHIPLTPESGAGQETYISILKSGGFTAVVRENMPEDLKVKIASESDDSLEQLVSFSGEGARLSVISRSGSELVRLSAKSRDAETSAAFATFVAQEYVSYAGERRNKKIDQDVEVNQTALESDIDLLEEARSLLGDYIKATPILISGRMNSSDFSSSEDAGTVSFAGDGEGESPLKQGPLKQASGADLQYYELVNLFQRKSKAVAELRDTVEKLKIEKELPFRDFELIREAEPPLEPSNSNLIMSVLFIVFAFFFGFCGWIVFRSSLGWLKTAE